MRTTLDIDDDLLAAAKELSRVQGRSAGQVVSALLRQALTGQASPAAAARRGRAGAGSVGGFQPFAARGRSVTNADIDALRDREGV
ncbi:MAG: type II toxin-antitoxin system VapB family antitoxin [Rubrivivax sp.]